MINFMISQPVNHRANLAPQNVKTRSMRMHNERSKNKNEKKSSRKKGINISVQEKMKFKAQKFSGHR